MARIMVHKAYSYREAEAFDRQFWRKAGAQARFAATWQMVVDFQKMKGKSSGQPRLRRVIQKLKRP